MATLKDIADEVGISVSATSLALRDHDTISLKTKLKVWEVQERLGYRLHLRERRHSAAIAENGNASESRDIAFLLVDRKFDEPAYAQSFQRLAEKAAAQNWRAIYVSATLKELHDGKIPSLLQDDRINGVLICGVYDETAHLNLTRALDIPMVMIGPCWLGETPWMACEPDIMHGMQLLFRRLTALGHTRFGLIVRGVESAFNFGIQQAYLAGIARGQGLINVGIGYENHRPDGDLEAAHELLKHQPTAIILASSLFASAVYEAAAAAGLKIPRDISVVSFKGGPELTLRPRLAQVGGEIMAGNILKKMEAMLLDPDTPRVRELHPMHFIPGGSIGVPPR